MSITCFIRYEIDPYKRPQFEQYASNWGQAIPRCGADYAPHEGSATTAYSIYNIDSLADYDAYRARPPQIRLIRRIMPSHNARNLF